jgi:hypothetical protein
MITAVLNGCTNYGIIKRDEVEVKFPIRVDTAKIQGNYQFEHNPNHPFFYLTIKNIKKIKINNITLEGVFDVILDFQPDTGEQLNETEFNFYYVYVNIKEGDIDNYLKLISDRFFFSTLGNAFNEEVISTIDTKNEMWYGFNFKDKKIFIWKENWESE